APSRSTSPTRSAVLPIAVAEGKDTQPPQCVRVDETARPPGAPAPQPLDLLAVHVPPPVLLPVPPAPGPSANRLLLFLAGPFRARTPPHLQRRERHDVDAHVVVFEMRTRLPQLSLRPVVRRVADRTIGPIGLAPQRALPVARLAQQMVPFDLRVVLRLEQIDVRWHVVADVVVDVANQSLLPREADDRREERFRHAVGDVHAFRIAPLGDDVAVARHQAARRTAVPAR